MNLTFNELADLSDDALSSNSFTVRGNN